MFLIIILVPATVTSLTALVLHHTFGDNVTFRFSLSNDDPPVQTTNIRWLFHTLRSTVDITDSSDDRHTLALDRLSFLIDGITHTDEGEYILQATNEAGTRTGSVFLSITGQTLLHIK